MLVEFETYEDGEMVDTKIEVPDDIIKEASEKAYNEDANMVIGYHSNFDKWVIAHNEDLGLQSKMAYNFVCTSSGLEN